MSTPKFQTDLFPDPKFNPVFQEDITSRTRLAPGITMGTFLGGHGDPVTLTHIESDDEKLRLAKQYVLHAQYMKIVRGLNQFLDYRIQVVESLYRSESSEILDASDGINYLMQRGRAVAYELIDINGELALEKTFDLSVFTKNYIIFDKLILDYDSYNPDETINAQIILVMPEIVTPWSAIFNNELETRFNNFVQSTNELVEVIQPTEDITNLV